MPAHTSCHKIDWFKSHTNTTDATGKTAHRQMAARSQPFKCCQFLSGQGRSRVDPKAINTKTASKVGAE
jgi:hypothetical protein